MDTRAFPTKGNLIANKNTLALASQGYDLMDRKRNILISEIVRIVDEVKEIHDKINEVYEEAYKALEQANVQLGIDTVLDMANAVELEANVSIHMRSVMGTDVPTTALKPKPGDALAEAGYVMPIYPFYTTRSSLDNAMKKFNEAKELSVKLAMLETAAFRLATNINKTQKRANALKNITMPRYEALVKQITDALEEKEREEFIRLKVIKKNKAGTL